MLDTTTKRRIDTARDILVGKVPDPKSQVEQITIALIYKFMDDMDAEGEELGGKRKFFASDYERYGWSKLMRSGLGGHETLNLYAEAVALWDAQCPQSAGLLQGGEGLATLNLQGTRNPFAWQALGNGDLLLGLVPAPGQNGQRLTIGGSPPIAERFLAKLLLLAPGRYRLSWRAGDNEGNQSDWLRPALVCKGESDNRLQGPEAGTDGRASALVTIGLNCIAQQLSFARSPGGGSSVWLQDVRLDRLP